MQNKNNKVKILVVEDEAIVAKDIQNSLEHLGFTVPYTVASGEAALERLRLESFDLVLMDVQLRGKLDGVRTAKKVKDLYRIPVVFLTAYSDNATLKRAKISEPFAYLLKPFDDRDLQIAIEISLYRNTMETKLRRSEEWLSTTLNSIGDGVIATDRSGKVNFMNPVAEKLTGWKEKDAIGREIKDVFHIINEETREKVANPIEKIFEDGAIIGLANHTILIKKNGLEIPIDDSASPIKDENGNVTGAVLVFHDASVQRSYEIGLQDSEERYRSLFESNPNPMWVFDTETLRFLAVNDAAITHYGYTKEEFLSMTILDIRQKKHHNALLKALDESPDDPHLEYVRFENWQHRIKGGKLIDVEVASHKMEWKGRNARLVMASDITARKRTEDALRFQAHLLNTINRAVMAVDLTGNVTYWNTYSETLFGWDSSEVVGKKFARNVTTMQGEDLNKVYEVIKKGKIWSGEYEAKRKDGSTFPAWGTVTGVYDDNGKLAGVLSVSRDFTKQKEFDEALRKRLKQQAIVSAIGQEALKVSDFSAIAKKAIKAISKTLDLDVCFMAILEDGVLDFRAVYAQDDELKQMVLQTKLPLRNAPMARRAFRENKIITVDYFPQKSGFAKEISSKFKLKSYACIPLGYADHKLGALYVFNKNKREFDQDDQYFLNLVAHTIATTFERDKTDKALRISELYLRRLKESNIIGMAFMDKSLKYYEANDALIQLLGYSQRDIQSGIVTNDAITPEHYRELDKKAKDELLKYGACKPFEKEVIRKDGRHVPVQVGSAVLDSKERTVISYMVDLTRLKNTEDALREINQTLEALIQFSPLGVIATDKKQHVTIWNPAAERLYGWSKREIIGRKIPEVFGDSLPIPTLTGTVNDNQVNDIELRQKRKDGTLIDVSLSAAPIYNNKNELFGSVAVITDITERKVAEKKVHSLAFYDQLTKLPNRTLFRNRLSYALSEAHRNRTEIAIMYIDLDRFKNINDSLGHKAGDILLKEVAKRLQSTVRETDTVSRLGGDEFAIILTDLDDGQNAAVVGDKVLKVLSKPIKLEKHEVFITPSIGISIFPHDSKEQDDLLMYADVAMYTAKREGKNRYHFYTSGMNTKVFERMIMDNNLRFALEREEFELYYQPKVNTLTGKVTSMEALIRWHHPEFGIVSPTVFIPLAEETGLIEPIGEWILRTACKQIKKWHKAGFKDLSMAVNLSVHQFRQKISDLVKRVLDEYEVDPKCLELEITESSIMASDEMVITMLQELRRMGITISIDDFGTGYSSLNRLSALPVDTLKIDQSFIRNLNARDESAAIVKAVIAIAKSMGLSVIAEGVETIDQVNFLSEQGCHNIQGYFISPAVPHHEFTPLLEKSFKQKINI